jgi:dTDP-4-amino-4,6-dideoxygalactose transaminase
MTAFLPFARPTLDEATIQSAADVLRSGWITSGPQLAAFEQALSEYCGGRLVRAVNSATAALEIALQICDIGPGDEVITCAESFFAAPNMILKVGAKPVFVDCDLYTRNINLQQVIAAITPRTKAILPTHFSGLPVDMDALYEIAKKYQLRVIEDAALAMGSSWRGRKIGSFGDLIVFSFHPNKNMTTIEGGALVVNSDAEVRRVEQLRFHGITRLPEGTRDVEVASGKFNLPDVNARIGLSQLKQLDQFNATRRTLAEHYFKHFQTDPPCLLPARAHAGDEAGHSWNMFTVLLPLEKIKITRKEFIDAMHARGIGIGVSYEALHLSTVCRPFGYHAGDFPNAERIARETVTLPLFPTMTLADVERVCAEVATIIAQSAR